MNKTGALLIDKFVHCSICGNKLKPTGIFFHDIITEKSQMSESGSSIFWSGWNQWLGTFCPNCGKVFCNSCLDANAPGLCPNCDCAVKPARLEFLKDKNIDNETPI